MTGADLVTLTGGEPFLQKKSDLHMFVDGLQMLGLGVECFSNGTIIYPDWAYDMVHFIMDWKLPGSGEDHLNPIRIGQLDALSLSDHIQAVKFVCKDEEDFYVAHSLWSLHLEDRPGIRTYYGKVWNGDITDAQLAELVMQNQLPWRMNVQLHNYIWDPQERGR
jgi:7-carboxy-7-deazaguanine synthase